MEEGSFLEILKALFKKKPKEFSEAEEEFKELLKDFKESDILGELEERLLLEVLNFKNIEVRELVIPRSQLVGLEVSMSWEEVKEKISKTPYTYYPVFKQVLDNFLGYVSLKDLVRGINQNVFTWQDFIKEPLIIPENISLTSALEKLSEKRLRLAFVIDELSEFTGIIRLKDILEEVILKEFKCHLPDKEGWYVFPGITKLREVEKCLNIKIPKGDYETISGFVIDNLKRIPKKGEKFKIIPLEIVILDSDERKIKELKVRPLKIS